VARRLMTDSGRNARVSRTSKACRRDRVHTRASVTPKLPPEALNASGWRWGGGGGVWLGLASYPLLYKYSEERTNSEPQLYQDDSAPWSGIMPNYVQEIVMTSRQSAGVMVRCASTTTWSVRDRGGVPGAIGATSGHSTCDSHLESPP